MLYVKKGDVFVCLDIDYRYEIGEAVSVAFQYFYYGQAIKEFSAKLIGHGVPEVILERIRSKVRGFPEEKTLLELSEYNSFHVVTGNTWKVSDLNGILESDGFLENWFQEFEKNKEEKLCLLTAQDLRG
jgi:hypothetical protein